MKVELFSPDPATEPRHWVRHDQAFAMMLGPGSIEWGSKRSALEKFNYAACDLALCHRHEGEWVGLMNVPHLQLGISDAALMAASDERDGEVELRPHRKFADSAWVRWLRPFMPRWWLGFRAGGCFWILSNRRWR
jgi:AraC family transcriptional regulator